MVVNEPLGIMVDGTELALLVASSFALEHWSFIQASAQALRTEPVRLRADSVRHSISEQARRA